MEEKTITLTEAELQARIDESVKSATDSLVAKHNGEMASMRKKYDSEIEKAKSQANMTAEELAQEKAKETENELNELRSYKRGREISDRLAKEGLPDYFKNDNRLINAEDMDKAIKEIKKDYEGTLKNGNNHSSVVKVNTTENKGGRNEVNDMVGALIKQYVGK